ncbi:MAG: GNAT family N-acetyltransferase [Methyloceanibacter sp.]
MTIREEIPADAQAIAAVHRSSFPTPLEAELVEMLRLDGDLSLSFVASIESEIVGHVAFCKAEVPKGESRVPVAWLAPLAVLPANRRKGIGTDLVIAGIEMCCGRGLDHAVVVGHPSYYGRFGFTHGAARKLESRWHCDALMALSLRLGGCQLIGPLIEPKAFSLLA